jgi:hypothetical protein
MEQLLGFNIIDTGFQNAHGLFSPWRALCSVPRSLLELSSKIDLDIITAITSKQMSSSGLFTTITLSASFPIFTYLADVHL